MHLDEQSSKGEVFIASFSTGCLLLLLYAFLFLQNKKTVTSLHLYTTDDFF